MTQLDKVPDSLDQEGWMVAEIERGLADLGAGKTVSHDEVRAWVASLEANAESLAPR